MSNEFEIENITTRQKIQLDSDEERDMQIIKSNFSCAICLSIIEGPCMPPCGHLFCSFCLIRWIKSNEESHCPKCRSPFNTNSIVYIANGYSTRQKKILNVKKKIFKPGISPQNMRFGNIIIYREESQKPTFLNIITISVLCLFVLFTARKIVTSL